MDYLASPILITVVLCNLCFVATQSEEIPSTQAYSLFPEVSALNRPSNVIQAPPEEGIVACKQCPPGYGVKTLCDGVQDTVCEKCPLGTYNPSYTVDSPCRPCGSCMSDHYMQLPCLSTQDVLCEYCLSGQRADGNEDFLRKCEPYLTTTTTTTVSPTTREQEADGESTSDPPNRVDDAWSVAAGNDSVTVIVGAKDVTMEQGGVTESYSQQHPAAPTTTHDRGVTTTHPPPPQTTTTAYKRAQTTQTDPPASTTRNQASDVISNVPVQGDKETTIGADATTSVAGAVAAEVAVNELYEVQNATFHWPILVAIVVAGVVCFALGVLVSNKVHKNKYNPRSQSQLRMRAEDPGQSVRTSMIRYTDNPDYPTPVNNNHVSFTSVHSANSTSSRPNSTRGGVGRPISWAGESAEGEKLKNHVDEDGMESWGVMKSLKYADDPDSDSSCKPSELDQRSDTTTITPPPPPPSTPSPASSCVREEDLSDRLTPLISRQSKFMRTPPTRHPPSRDDSFRSGTSQLSWDPYLPNVQLNGEHIEHIDTADDIQTTYNNAYLTL